MAVKTNFTSKDFSQILSKYDLGAFKEFKVFEAGQDQTNLLLLTTKHKVVLRYYEKRSSAYVNFELELLHYLVGHGYPCAAPLVNAQGEYTGIYKGKPFALFKFLSGEHINNPQNYLQVAEAIGKLHILTVNYRPVNSEARPTYSQEYCWSWTRKSAKKIASKQEAHERTTWMKEELAKLKLPDTLPKGVCHGDPNPSNFLYQNGKLSGVLDFDQASYTWLLYDVAQMIYWWAWPDKGEIDITATKKLIERYEQQRKMTREEQAHLFDALKLVILIGMGWFLNVDDDYANGKRKVEQLNLLGKEDFSPIFNAYLP